MPDLVEEADQIYRLTVTLPNNEKIPMYVPNRPSRILRGGTNLVENRYISLLASFSTLEQLR